MREYLKALVGGTLVFMIFVISLKVLPIRQVLCVVLDWLGALDTGRVMLLGFIAAVIGTLASLGER